MAFGNNSESLGSVSRDAKKRRDTTKFSWRYHGSNPSSNTFHLQHQRQRRPLRRQKLQRVLKVQKKWQNQHLIVTVMLMPKIPHFLQCFQYNPEERSPKLSKLLSFSLALSVFWPCSNWELDKLKYGDCYCKCLEHADLNLTVNYCTCGRSKWFPSWLEDLKLRWIPEVQLLGATTHYRLHHHYQISFTELFNRRPQLFSGNSLELSHREDEVIITIISS